MVFLGNFLAALAKVLHIGLRFYLWIVILRAVLSWFHVPSLYSVNVVLYRLTEPALRPFRRIVPPPRIGGVDISPILLALVIVFMDSFLVGLLAHYARQILAEASASY